MSRRQGFTLIELLVVIAIIAILMGILMPALHRVRKQAQAVTCRAHLKSWGLFFKFYTDEYDGKFNSGWGVGQAALWMNALRPYYQDDEKLMRCPTAKVVVIPGGDWGTFKSWQRDNVSTPEGGTRTFIGSYSINSWTNNMTADRGDRKLASFWRTTHNMKNVQNNIPVFGDSTWHDAWPKDIDQPSVAPDDFGTGDQGASNEMRHFAIDRHNGAVNMVFMDWSVRPVGLKELWTLKWHRQFNTAGPWTVAGGVQGSDWPSWMRRYSEY